MIQSIYRFRHRYEKYWQLRLWLASAAFYMLFSVVYVVSYWFNFFFDDDFEIIDGHSAIAGFLTVMTRESNYMLSQLH